MQRLHLIKDSSKGFNNLEEVLHEAKFQVQEILKGNYGSSISYNLSSEDTETLRLELSLIEGVRSATIQTLSYPFGCGGMYGSGIEVKFDQAALPTILWQEDGNFLVNTEHFLAQFKRCEKSELILQDIFEDDEGSFIEYLESINPDLNYNGDNSYNHTSDLSNDINFWMPSCENFESMDQCLVIVKIHCGGDIRGNYTSNRIYRLGFDDYCNFVSSMQFGFWSEQTDHYTSAYTSNPQYSFFEDHDLVSIDKERNEITVRSKETGEIKKFIADVNF